MEIMLDLETLGCRPGSVIASVGAVAFDRARVESVDEVIEADFYHPSSFYVLVDPVSAEGAGLKLDASTVLWWFQQSEVARAEIAGGVSLEVAMRALEIYASEHAGAPVWAKGADFDFPMLDEARRALRKEPLWGRHSRRCLRTLVDTIPRDLLRELDKKNEKACERLVRHNAMHDAARQARLACLVFAELGV